MQKVIDFLKECVPQGDKYIVLPEMNEKERGGIIYETDTNKGEERTQKGVILAKGKGRIPESGEGILPMEFAIGQVVVFKKFAGDELLFNEELKMFPGHTDNRSDLVFVKIINQESILFSLPI